MLKPILCLLILHFVSDQVLQLHSVQSRKHKETNMMLVHVGMWAVWLLPFSMYAGWSTENIGLMFGWPLTMAAIHFSIEWMLTRAWETSRRHYIVLSAMIENVLVMLAMILTFQYFVLWT
jgi:hypothetical protein